MGKKGKETEEPQFKPISLAIEDAGTLILALKSKELAVAGKACEALDQYAEISEKNKEHVASLGGLEALVELVDHEDDGMKHRATMCLSTLTKNYAVRLQCKRDLNEQLLPRLMPMLSPPTPPVGQENATAIIANLCTEFSVRKQVLQQDAAGPLVALLSAQQPDLIRYALQALLALCEDYEGRVQVMAAEPTQALLSLLDSDYRAIQELALNVVAKAARNQSCRHTLYEAGVLERIVGFATNPEYSKSYVVALDALSTMLHERPALERVGAVPDNGKQADAPLVKVLGLLKEEDPAVKVQAMRCLQTAAHDSDNRRILRDFRTEDALAAQLVPDDPKQPINSAVSCAACNALSALAVSKSSALAVVGAGSPPKLSRLLSCEHESCVLAAAQTLSVLVAKSSPNRMQVYDAGVYPTLLDILNSISVQRVPTQVHAATCVGAFARESQLRANMRTSSPVVALVDLLDKGPHTSQLQQQALDALTALVVDDAYRKELADASPFAVLVRLITSPEQRVGLAAARIVHQLCEDPGCAAALTHEGALDALRTVTASRSHSSHTMQAAVRALLANHLSAKFALENRLDEDDRIAQVFFDAGKVHMNAPVPRLRDLLLEPRSNRRPVLLINPTGEKSNERLGIERLPHDDAFCSLLKELQTQLSELDQQEKYNALATAVAERMGGSVPESKMKQYSSRLHLAHLQAEHDTNVLPIGLIEQGSYLERALLFKALADHAGVRSSLVRGDYGRAYNVISSQTQGLCVVDVLHKPGSLHPIPSLSHLHTNHPFVVI